MSPQFKKVLEKIIFPQFPEVAYVEVDRIGFGDYYKVHYVLKDKWKEPYRPIELQDETVNLFKMMSPDRFSDIYISMSPINDE